MAWAFGMRVSDERQCAKRAQRVSAKQPAEGMHTMACGHAVRGADGLVCHIERYAICRGARESSPRGFRSGRAGWVQYGLYLCGSVSGCMKMARGLALQLAEHLKWDLWDKEPAVDSPGIDEVEVMTI